MTLYDRFCASSGVVTDSRRIVPECLFFALKGASFDGNRFAADALAKGALCAVVDDPRVVEEHPDLGDRLCLVEDTLKALQELARTHRRRLGIPILAVVGSNGKTTTKELAAAVLGEKFALHATVGNLNNHIGVPLTLLSLGSDKEFAVVEMGASACGEIALLASIAEPDYGIITNIGRSHLEGFGGVEGIRRGKGELFDYLEQRGGCAFVPVEDATLCGMAEERREMKRIYYSTSIAQGVKHQLEGDFNRLNVAAAMAIGEHFGVERERILHAIASYVPQNHRSQRLKTMHNTLILDCYNANPSSMAASVEHFAKEPSPEGRKLLVLGDMLELGEWSAVEHEQVLRRAAAIASAELWLVGPRFGEASERVAPTGRVRCFGSADEVADFLKANPLQGALVLLKGSHSIGLDRLAQYF